jgi:putative mycofactocin binding protein MftB
VLSADPDGVLKRRWRLHPQVALRQEPFGALAYHFGTRRLSLLKSPALLEALERLAEHRTAGAALRAAGVEEAQLPPYAHALAALAHAGMICEAQEG